MSMLTEQTKKLRKTAYEVDNISNDTIGLLTRDSLMLADAAKQMREAADTIADLRETLRSESDARMDLQRDYNNQIKRIQNQRKQLREMQAALERGTCELEINTDMTAVKCSKCGYVVPKGTDLMSVMYCAGCGRKVAE